MSFEEEHLAPHADPDTQETRESDKEGDSTLSAQNIELIKHKSKMESINEEIKPEAEDTPTYSPNKKFNFAGKNLEIDIQSNNGDMPKERPSATDIQEKPATHQKRPSLMKPVSEPVELIESKPTRTPMMRNVPPPSGMGDRKKS